MREIVVSKGVIFENGKVISALEADTIALANGDLYAEMIVKRFTDKKIILDSYNKIISISDIAKITIELDTVELQRMEALRILNHEYRPGDQVRYIPSHANKNPMHEDCQTGIVVSKVADAEACLVRYFRDTYLQATPQVTANCSLKFWGEPIKL